MVQSLAGVYGEQTQAVWGWLLPNILPTLSLVIGVFAATALKESAETDTMRVRRSFARLATALSIFHLISVGSVFIAQVYLGTTQGQGARSLALFEMANLWLGPLQGLVAAVLGALFFSSETKARAEGLAAAPAMLAVPAGGPG